MNWLKKKSFESVIETDKSSSLEKTLGAFDLIMLGLGGIIGSGVFVFTGLVAAKYSGPAVMLSYAIAGITCIFVALAYTELASMIPSSGSVYTYSYVAFGEIFAWIVGAVIILELTFGAATVAAGWSAYVQSLLGSVGIELPKQLSTTPSNGGIINLLSVVILSFVAFILYLGTTESKKLNTILVAIKMAAIFTFIFFAAPHFDQKNWLDFMPYGFDDVLVGASILFFAYTGFGTLASAAEETKNPKRDLTIGIIASLVLSTLVYVLIAGLTTGIIDFKLLDNAQPLAFALKHNGNRFGTAIVSTGAVCGMTTVVMMNIYGQSRIFYAMARDGLLPKAFAKIHEKYNSPSFTIFFFCAIAALLSGFVPYQILGQLTSMGAITDYIFVVMAVMLFRFSLPNAPRPFKCPALFIVAPVALLLCVYLLFKQILTIDGSLMLSGQLYIMWLILMIVVYIVLQQFKLRKRQA